MHKQRGDFELVIFNLGNAIMGYLGEDRAIDAKSTADLIREHGKSPVIQMALIAALVNDDADYQLKLVENVKKHPGGAPKIQEKIAQIRRAEAVSAFIDQAEADGGGTEAAIAMACAHFSLSRSTVFRLRRLSRLMNESLTSGAHQSDRNLH